MAAMVHQCNNCYIDAKDTNEKQLFVCGVDQCRIQWRSLCMNCGETTHTNSNVFNHEFGCSGMQLQSQYAKTIMKYKTTTSNANNVAKKAVGLGAFATVGTIQVGMLEAIKEFGMKEGIEKFTKNLTKYGKGATAVIQVALCVWECGYELKRYNDETISGKECTRLITRSITANSAAFGGALGGAAIGGALGGLPGAALGTVIGGVVGDLGTRFVFDRFIWDDEDVKMQEKEINHALQSFGFIGCNMRNVMDTAEFTREQVQKGYYGLALRSHPDTKHGTNEKFAEVLKKYNILLGVVKGKEAK